MEISGGHYQEFKSSLNFSRFRSNCLVQLTITSDQPVAYTIDTGYAITEDLKFMEVE
jgi:hypothetical protein